MKNLFNRKFRVSYKRAIGAIVAATMISTSLPVSIFASSASDILPVAGIARALNEGKSVAGVKAEKIKEEAGSDSSVHQLASLGDEIKSSDVDFGTKVSTIKETVNTSEPAIITVGEASAASSETISENEVLAKSANLVVPQEEETSEAAEENDSDIELVDVSGEKQNTEDEEFENLVIAKVHDYVNVRQEPSEDSEIVGKLYNKSVGDLLEEAGDWYKIRSGNCTGYVKGEFVVTGDEAKELAKEVGTRMAVVTTTTLYVREEPSTGADVIGMVPIEDELTVSEELDGWAKVSVEEGEGYVSTDYVKLYTYFVRAESKEEEERRLAKEEAARKAAQEAARKAAKRQQQNAAAGKKQSGKNSGAVTYAPPSGGGNGGSVASFALQFVGNPYVYGGSSLTNGTDCSGFVMSVYRNFGVSLPHSSGGDRGVGYDVGGLANAQAGDIVCYSGHVGIYIGGGQIVHASTPSSGIKVSSANYRPVLAVRRIF